VDPDLLQDLDGWLRIVNAFCAKWTSVQRSAFLVATAERWFPRYVAFSAAEGWGDPDDVRAALDAAWHSLSGVFPDAQTLRHHRSVVVNAAPSADDFDAWDATTACHLSGLALDGCCADTRCQSVAEAVGATYDAVLEAVPGYPTDPNANRKIWRQPAVRAEIGSQFALMRMLASCNAFTPQIIAALQRNVVG
jgi:uncharacterized protein YjaG (DUF416 family)